MLTLFTIPKPFRENFDRIQRNAIESWTRLDPPCEILLFGDEDGTARAAQDLGVKHVPQITRNEYGTPLLDSVFLKAQKLAAHDRMCFINTDIILMKDFVSAVGRVGLEQFLLIGERWDLDTEERIDFSQDSWEETFRTRAYERGNRHKPWGSDYFVFRRDASVWAPPAFAVGRMRYDSWLIWRALSLKIPVIDATAVIFCAHQNHPRTYSSMGMRPVGGKDDLRDGLEAKRNKKLTEDKIVTIHQATHELTPDALRPKRSVPPPKSASPDTV